MVKIRERSIVREITDEGKNNIDPESSDFSSRKNTGMGYITVNK